MPSTEKSGVPLRAAAHQIALPIAGALLGAGLLAGCGQQAAPVQASLSGFRASQSTLPSQGGQLTLRWSGTDALSYRLTGSGGAGSSSLSLAQGSDQATVTLPYNYSQSPLAETYTLTAQGSQGSAPASQSVTVTVAGVQVKTVSLASALGLSSGEIILFPKVAVDSQGNVWMLSVQDSGGANLKVTEYDPADGKISVFQPDALSPLSGENIFFTGLTADPYGNVWIRFASTASDNDAGVLEIQQGTTPSQLAAGQGIQLYQGGAVAGTAAAGPSFLNITSDPQGNIWIAGTEQPVEIPRGVSPSQLAANTPPTYSGLGLSVSLASDPQGNLWDWSFNGFGQAQLIEIPAGVSPSAFDPASLSYNLGSVGSRLGPGLEFFGPEQIGSSLAADPGGNLWLSDTQNTAVLKVPSDLSPASFDQQMVSDPSAFLYTGFNSPFATAVDSFGNVFVAGLRVSGGETADQLSRIPAGAQSSQYSALSNTFLGTSALGLRSNAAIDASGNVWMATQTGLAEFVGVAAQGNLP
jgi:hypothetical protein